MADTWCTGKANNDVATSRGWLLGHFIEPRVGTGHRPFLGGIGGLGGADGSLAVAP
jgi:hypothetical protein